MPTALPISRFYPRPLYSQTCPEEEKMLGLWSWNSGNNGEASWLPLPLHRPSYPFQSRATSIRLRPRIRSRLVTALRCLRPFSLRLMPHSPRSLKLRSITGALLRAKGLSFLRGFPSTSSGFRRLFLAQYPNENFMCLSAPWRKGATFLQTAR